MTYPKLFRYVLIGALIQSAGCRQETDNSYFPLNADMAWEYRIEYRVKEESRTQRLIYLGRPPVNLDQQRYFQRVSLSGHRDYYQKTDEGIIHVDPVSGDRSHILPNEIEAGRQWQAESRVRILEVTGAFTPTFEARAIRPITMDYVIEETGESVEVPAGRFDNCIRVRAKGRLFAGRTLQEYMGIDSINIEQTEWYAPGTGLVKTVRTEYTEPNEFTNTYSQELLTFARN